MIHVISQGTQTTENGPIEWARDLPSHCQLSVGLRKLTTPLLAGLLEVDPHRIWTFEKFFTEVQIATSTKPVHVFHVNKAASIKVRSLLGLLYKKFTLLLKVNKTVLFRCGNPNYLYTCLTSHH